MRQMLVCAVAAAVLLLEGGGSRAFAAAVEPANAEYVIRWNARDGGPATINDTLGLLKSRATRDRKFKVDYYDLPPKLAAPPGYSVILRRRVEEGVAAELTWKLRGDAALADWTCPLRNAKESKAEVDVALQGADTVARSFSYSCTSDGPDAAAAELSATLKGCAAIVTRRVAGPLKLEEWHFPGDVVIIDVAMSGANNPGSLELFRTRIAQPLFAAGVVALAESKADLGSHCK
jgi:hypothetical protein